MARISIELPDTYLFEAEIVVRASDLNYGNHVGHDSILTLMQEARLLFYRKLGFKNELSFDGPVGQVISDAALVYKSESFLGDELVCRIAAADLHKYGFDLLYLLTNKETGKEVARGKTGIVCFDYDKRKIALVPQVLLDKLNAPNLSRY
jgi:acyl-CoA thioester hydrolase